MSIHGYMDVNTGEYPLHEGDIRLRFPDMGEEFVCPPGFEAVMWSPVPERESEIWAAREIAPERIDGVLYQRYEPFMLPAKITPSQLATFRAKAKGKEVVFPTPATGRIDVASFGFTE